MPRRASAIARPPGSLRRPPLGWPARRRARVRPPGAEGRRAHRARATHPAPRRFGRRAAAPPVPQPGGRGSALAGRLRRAAHPALRPGGQSTGAGPPSRLAGSAQGATNRVFPAPGRRPPRPIRPRSALLRRTQCREEEHPCQSAPRARSAVIAPRCLRVRPSWALGAGRRTARRSAGPAGSAGRAPAALARPIRGARAAAWCGGPVVNPAVVNPALVEPLSGLSRPVDLVHPCQARRR